MKKRGLVYLDFLNKERPSMPVKPKFKVLFRKYEELNNYAFLILTTQKWVLKKFHIEVNAGDYQWIDPKYSQLNNPGFILLEQSTFESIDEFESKKCRHKCPKAGKLTTEKISSIEGAVDEWKNSYRKYDYDKESKKIKRRVLLILQVEDISHKNASKLLKNDIESKFGIKI
jgi:hypothetical protein